MENPKEVLHFRLLLIIRLAVFAVTMMASGAAGGLLLQHQVYAQPMTLNDEHTTNAVQTSQILGLDVRLTHDASRIEDLDRRVALVEGVGVGVTGLFGLLIGLQTVLQFRGKK